MSRHKKHLQGSASQVQPVPGLQGGKLHRAVRHKGGFVRQVCLSLGLKLSPDVSYPGGQGAAVQHGNIRRMDGAPAKLKYAPRVVHVAVGQRHLDGQVRQGGHKLLQAPNAGHGVNQHSLRFSFHQKTVDPRGIGDLRHLVGKAPGLKGRFEIKWHKNSSSLSVFFIINPFGKKRKPPRKKAGKIPRRSLTMFQNDSIMLSNRKLEKECY